MLPANPLISWPDPFKIFLPASLTHGFHTSFLGVFYLESTNTFLPLSCLPSGVFYLESIRTFNHEAFNLYAKGVRRIVYRHDDG